MTSFERAMEFISKWEWRGRLDGAPTNDPKDPGGFTKFGIAQKFHPELVVANLTLQQALEIYWKDYWLPSNAGSYPTEMAIAVMDAAVNCGVSRAKAWARDSKTARELNEKRISFYLSKKNPRFEKGWINRVNDLNKYLDIIRQDA